MIPVRVPHDLTVHTVGDDRTLQPGHPLFHELCPVCDCRLADEAITLVAVGIDPEDRKDHGWTNGGAVAVHAACAGPNHNEGRAQQAEAAAKQAGEINHHLIAQAQQLAGQLTAVAAIVNELKADPAVRVARPDLVTRLEAALKPSTEDQ